MSKASPANLFVEPTKASRDKKRTLRRANDLTGKEWTRYSISAWNDIRKTSDELKVDHPAMFPQMLVDRLLRCFTNHTQKVVLDPFCGSGATLLAARRLGKLGIGFEVSQQYYDLALERVRTQKRSMFTDVAEGPEPQIHLEDARRVSKYLRQDAVDICITSPPYWDILSRKRTADYKETRDYAGAKGDLSRITEYEQFMDALAEIFCVVYEVLRPGGYCIVVVMDIRKQNKFYPFHSDLAKRLSSPDVGFIFDDLIIWDRRQEYNNLRPLGFPTTFRINKIHEYLLIFRKP